MEIIEDGCPFCKSDVKGSKKNKFYCEKCNLLFSKEDLKMRPREEK